MDTNSNIKALPLSELLPVLNDLLPVDRKLKLTAKKQTQQNIAQTCTTKTFVKPLTMAEMKAEILALKGQTPKNPAPAQSSIKKKIWNSSAKVDNKTTSYTTNKSLKNNPVRKFLNFQTNPKPIPNIKATMTPASPKFHKPEFRSKKSILLQAKNNVRISGISSISETPVINHPIRRKISIANKENILHQSDTKKSIPSSVINHKKLAAAKPDTPTSNDSWKSSCDASFLQKEKEINDDMAKVEALIEEKTLENIAEVSPPASTPFREYRSIQEFFNTSNDNNSTMYQDNTIMEFEEPARHANREDSVIVSLCDLLNKTTVNGPQNNTEVEDLVQIEKQIQQNINMIENFIEAANKIKKSQLISLQSVKKLIKDKEKKATKTHNKNINDEKTSKITKNEVEVESTTAAVISDDKDSKPTVITIVKSPSYKVPKKNTSLRKKVYCKSMPNITSDTTPVKVDMGNRALSVYMKMKQHMDFLNTPVTKRHLHVPDTPGVTSHNLQKQLNKLYGEE